jgi:hypothetical protein
LIDALPASCSGRLKDIFPSQLQMLFWLAKKLVFAVIFVIAMILIVFVVLMIFVVIFAVMMIFVIAMILIALNSIFFSVNHDKLAVAAALQKKVLSSKIDERTLAIVLNFKGRAVHDHGPSIPAVGMSRRTGYEGRSQSQNESGYCHKNPFSQRHIFLHLHGICTYELIIYKRSSFAAYWHHILPLTRLVHKKNSSSFKRKKAMQKINYSLPAFCAPFSPEPKW